MEQILKHLKASGFRITKARKAIINSLHQEHCALSARDLHLHLKKVGLKPDTSTIYRELQFLTAQKITEEVIFKDGVMRYELIGDEHHHHLVCTTCDHVTALEMEPDLKTIEACITKQGFRISSHSLEFYGLCKSCQ